MRHLNYNHLYYFWTIAREGTIARAAEALYLTPQTISTQVKSLEEVIGEPLFERRSRKIALTDTGRMVMQYADEIFTLGSELSQRVRNGAPGVAMTINVGVVSSIAKLIAARTIESALEPDSGYRVACLQGELERLLADMALARIDLVISDRPLPRAANTKAFNHELGESPIGFFVATAKAPEYGRGFPRSLDGAPMLLPLQTSALRNRLDQWFDAAGVRPRVVGEFDDSALLKAAGSSGYGLFPAPTAIATQVENMYGTRLVGEAEGLTEKYYAISPERKINNPGVLQIIESTKSALF